ncbi:MAG TPA: hypothetical protein VG248_13925 [Caulobacteraceae bacterium]|jgi:hypothetical protein|nr:hypothetical protein [Caulobacteraceae bacterium]
MKTFEFTVIAAGLDPHAEDFEGRFFDAGCDDATVAFQKGRILVDFARDAPSLEAAIAGAIQNVRQAGAVVERVEPDPLVNLSDMAGRADLTRAALTNYFKGARGKGFPPPRARVTTDSPLWDWADVSLWLYHQGRLSRDAAAEAAVFSAANEVIGCEPGAFTAQLHEGVRERLAGL